MIKTSFQLTENTIQQEERLEKAVLELQILTTKIEDYKLQLAESYLKDSPYKQNDLLLVKIPKNAHWSNDTQYYTNIFQLDCFKIKGNELTLRGFILANRGFSKDITVIKELDVIRKINSLNDLLNEVKS